MVGSDADSPVPVHATQVGCPPALYIPWVHCVHSVAPTARASVPVGHGVHGVSPLVTTEGMIV